MPRTSTGSHPLVFDRTIIALQSSGCGVWVDKVLVVIIIVLVSGPSGGRDSYYIVGGSDRAFVLQ